ncbi:Ty1/Copia family ribonuclease HI [Klebsiella pneumoniae]|uniref:Ty1/Copia family ribonuclease HI n=1 Tax=Klebsiella pneumoniae TaxID=573 RepID=UPI003A7FC892
MKNILKELHVKQERSVLFCDSQSAIHLAKNHVFHARTKHIRMKYHFIRTLLEDEELSLEKNRGTENPTDMLTKAVVGDKLRLGMTLVGLNN